MLATGRQERPKVGCWGESVVIIEGPTIEGEKHGERTSKDVDESTVCGSLFGDWLQG